jgi:hypothetical protein
MGVGHKSGGSPEAGKSGEPGDPMRLLSQNIYCADPPAELGTAQLCALHEFFHEVLAAGYKLYQKVPPDTAAKVVREKFTLMVGALPADPGKKPDK